MYIHKDFNPQNIICKSKKSQTTPHVSPQNPTTHVIPNPTTRVIPNFHSTVILNSFQDLFPKFTIPLIIRRCPSAQIKSQTKKSPHALAKKISDFPPSNQFPTHRSRSGFPFQFKKSPVRTAPAPFSSFPLQSLTQPSLQKKKIHPP